LNQLNILIIKLSSLGDVLHNLPIVWDIRARYPQARLDWLVEENYVELLEPLKSRADFKGIDNIIPIAMRRWKKNLFTQQTRQEWRTFYQTLRTTRYDRVIETQGLIKAAWLTRLAKRQPDAVIAGLANATEDSGYEPLARCFYQKKVQVPLHCHAVERSRLVAAAAIGTDVPLSGFSTPKFYPADFVENLQASSSHFKVPYVIFFHATAREAKKWPESHWIEIGQQLSTRGRQVTLPWGNLAEKEISERLAMAIPNAIVPPAFSVRDWFGVIAEAELVVGVDTGLTHLAAVMNKPTIELYCDSPRWKTEAYWSGRIKNLGDTGKAPSEREVSEAVEALLA
jgi:heptosyltransferase I